MLIAEGPEVLLRHLSITDTNISDKPMKSTQLLLNLLLRKFRDGIKRNLFKENPNVKLISGLDNTGNIYKLENIKHFEENKRKGDFITADGGFDFSSDFNDQEKQSLRIIFCEFSMA